MAGRVRSLFVTVVCASIALSAGVPADAEKAFADSVDQEALQRYVRELVALGPRMGGTPSGDRAEEYLRQDFAGLGLETTVVDDAPLWASWAERWRVELEPSGVPIESAWPYAFSPSMDPPRSARLLVVDSLETVRPEPSWNGAVLYTPGPVANSVYGAIDALPHAPVAILTSWPNSPSKNPEWSRPGSLPEDDTNRVPVFAISYADGRRVSAAAAAGAGVRLSLVAHARRARPKTVMATLRGANPERHYLVSAHGDSGSGGPGADDNASGVATLMEIARILTDQTRRGVLQPAVSVRFVIWGTEYHSARSYIQRERTALERCAGVINFDQTGTGAEREAIYVEGNDVPWNGPLLRVFDRVGADYLDRPGFWPEVTTTPTQGGTDSYVFLPREYKGTGDTALRVPSITIYTAAWDETRLVPQTPGWHSKGWRSDGPIAIDYSRYYHSSADTPENTTDREPQNMVRAVRLAGVALVRLLTGEGR